MGPQKIPKKDAMSLYMDFMALDRKNQEDFLRLVNKYYPMVYTAARMTFYERKCFSREEDPKTW